MWLSPLKPDEFGVNPEVNMPQTPHMTHNANSGEPPLGAPWGSRGFGSPRTSWMGLRYVDFGVVGYGAHGRGVRGGSRSQPVQQLTMVVGLSQAVKWITLVHDDLHDVLGACGVLYRTQIVHYGP